MSREFVEGRFHTLPAPVGEPGVVATLLRAIPECFAPTDLLHFVTPYGDAFRQAVEAHARREGRWLGRFWTIPVGDPQVATLAGALGHTEREGVVYLTVLRGEEELLTCEQTYAWLWMNRELPEIVDTCVLAAIDRHWRARGGSSPR